MTLGNLGNLGNLGGLLTNGLTRGIVIQAAPNILKGAMKEYLCKVKFNDMVKFVNENHCLWEEMPANIRESLSKFGPKLGELEWMSVEWAIQAARESAPSLASLFLGWPEGQTWLACQVEDLKCHIKGVK